MYCITTPNTLMKSLGTNPPGQSSWSEDMSSSSMCGGLGTQGATGGDGGKTSVRFTPGKIKVVLESDVPSSGFLSGYTSSSESSESLSTTLIGDFEACRSHSPSELSSASSSVSLSCAFSSYTGCRYQTTMLGSLEL